MKGIVLFLLGFGSCLAQEQSYTLDGFIAIAQEHSMSQKRTTLSLQEASLDVKAVKAALKPQLTLNAQLPNFYKSSSAITQPDGSISFLPLSQDDSDLQLQLSKQIGATNTLLFSEVNLKRYENFTADAVLYNSVPFRIGVQQGINTFNSIRWQRQLNDVDYQIAS